MPSISFKVNPEDAEITEVIPGLYICGVTALTAKNMEKFNITLIINATNEVPNFKALGNIRRIKLWVDDNSEAQLLPHFDEISDQVNAEIEVAGNVLIHCVAGVSRSATLCLAFLTKYKCRSLRDAYHLMASKRPMVRPVLGFWRQLITFEQDIKKAPASVRLIHDDTQTEKLLPDVYLKDVLPERTESDKRSDNVAKVETYYKLLTGAKRKFHPVLETLTETTEMQNMNTFPQLTGNIPVPLQNCENYGNRKCRIAEIPLQEKTVP